MVRGLAMIALAFSSAKADGPQAPGGEDESALFADTSVIMDSAKLVGNAWATASGIDRKTLGYSGNILSVAGLGADRSYFGTPDAKHTSLAGAMVGEAEMDARLLRGYRAFANLEFSVNPDPAGAGGDTGTDFRVPEMFLDANIGHKAYFRVGKQVLQWGRCYFFNPTDLINIERKSFFRRIGNREGTYGAKVHVPFGTVANLYGFLDTHGVGRPDSLAGAAKAEFLAGRTEFSFMMWDKGGRDPVYGADISTRALGIDINGEAALFQSFDSKVLTFPGGFPHLETRHREWAPRLAVGLGRSFRVSGIQDRLTTVAEFYYNQPGTEAKRMPFPDSISIPATADPSLTSRQAFAALAAAGIYEPNSYSRHYAAFFATFNRFFRSDMALTFNVIGNVDQECALVSTGISYRDLNDFGLSLVVNGFAGPAQTEYTFSRQAMQVQLLAEAAF